MTDRDIAILNKALCYGISAFTVSVCAIFHMAGSDMAFMAGVFAGVMVVPVAEFLIVIPPRGKEGDDA